MLKSFGYALNGWRTALKERNFKTHLYISVCVILAAIFFQISSVEWLIVLLLIGAVITTELINTAIEEICDLLTAKLKLQYSDTTAPRDLAAGAVLIIASVAALVGLIIFVPKVLTLLL